MKNDDKELEEAKSVEETEESMNEKASSDTFSLDSASSQTKEEPDEDIELSLEDSKNEPDSEDLSESNVSLAGTDADIGSDSYGEDEVPESDSESKKKVLLKAWKKVLIEALVVCGLILVAFSIFTIQRNTSGSNEGPAVVETETDQMTETEAATEPVTETEFLQPGTELQIMESETVETENWQDTIFGEESTSLLPNIDVSGLTSAQKDRSKFRETDFLQALSDFLDENHITGITQVNFEEEIICSSDGAYAYRATLGDRTDKVLNVICYPDYPGRYILTLEDAQEVTVEVQTQSETNASVQTQTQTVTPTQEYYYQSETQAQTEVGSNETQRTYDATTLSVYNIPDTLGNYISNQYELQYTLYDYLYRNGYDYVTVASVMDYEINPDTRQATIYFVCSEGVSVTGIYDKDTNTYSYQ